MRSTLLPAALSLFPCLPLLPAQVLEAPQSFASAPLGFLPRFALVDGNGDGALDLVQVTTTGIQLQPGDGAGGFGAPVVSPLGGPFESFGSKIQVVDMNSDGHPDVAWGGGFGSWIRFGDGTGAFPGPGIAANLGNFVLMDWNRDGHLDIVQLQGFTNLFVAVGDGSGAFAAPTPIAFAPAQVPLPTLSGTTSVDVDGDGHPELVLVGTGMMVVYGDGLGGVASTTLLFPSLSGTGRFADFDHDGLLDVVFATGLQVRTMHNDGSGGFTPGPTSALSQPASDLGVVDFDGDGFEDLVVLSNGAVEVLLGAAGGAFAPPQVLAAYATAAFPAPSSLAYGLGLGDLDHDGRTDLVTRMTLSNGPVPAVISTLRNALPPASGLSGYGTGTPTCSGTMGLTGSRRPSIGASDFAVLCSNAPSRSVGLLALGTQVAGGWDPLGLGITLHLGFALPAAAASSDGGGAARFPLPIPAIPFLVGLRVHAQAVWMGDAAAGDTCSPGQYELATSRGLSIRLLP